LRNQQTIIRKRIITGQVRQFCSPVIEIDEALVLLERKIMQRDLGMRCEPLAAPAMVYNGERRESASSGPGASLD
jgi:hypothetical protein